ncbi:serine/threonine phosphatase [Pleurocapsa sp. PCC 7319]|uniref:serine/threonine phosphatase n=1 Tax=Pleurocapsa sp. PCC 7319 TaxID=118161 RepID=UPI000344C44D|nr:serine/threonine phosphatase [Pleurocapsa sp. PCC 7319]
MLICPQCGFENSQANKFCQSCGFSLNDKICCQCTATIPVESETCSFCGAENNTVLWAIIAPKNIAEVKGKAKLAPTTIKKNNSNIQSETEDLSDLFAEIKDEAKTWSQVNDKHHNTLNRYVIAHQPSSEKLLNDPRQTLDTTLIQGQVIDQYPLQESYLAALQKQQLGLFTKLSQNLNNSYLSMSQYWNLVGIPIHALPYLILEKYTPTVPQIYDAWQQQEQGVVILPDRSQWKLLTELWSEPKLPLLQIIWFLDEMAKLWEPLQLIGCAQSLLVNSNLRIDEDQSFCFQQLYMDSTDQPPSLKDLAKTWQLCFTESNLNNLNHLNLLLDRVISGEINEIEQLRLELHNLGLGEDEIESFDIHTNYSEVNISQPEPKQTKPDNSLETSEPDNFFDENDDNMMYGSEFEEEATAMIPMQLKSITDASCTAIGSQRDHNEDFFGVQTRVEKVENNIENNLRIRGLYLVCDGMGGHAAGEVASAMAVDNLQKYFQTHWQNELPTKKTIEQGVLLANEALYQTNLDNSRSGSGRMGTTLVMALLQDTKLAIAHVGDSRIYRISRKQGLEKLTLDHEVGQREINRGVEPDIAYGRPDSYQLTQALGPRESNYVRPDIQFLEITEDCLLLLCSDGLSDNDLLEKHWKTYLEPLISSSSDIHEGTFKLVDFANHYNGHDNISAILVRIKLKPDL